MCLKRTNTAPKKPELVKSAPRTISGIKTKKKPVEPPNEKSVELTNPTR